MQIRLSLSLEPYTDEWSTYCAYVLQLLKDNPTAKADLLALPDANAFTLAIHGVTQQAAYFKSGLSMDDSQAMLRRWALNLGVHALCLTPRVETSKKSSGGEVLFLAAYIEGPDRDVGVFRLCSQLVHNAERLTDADLQKLRDLVVKVT